MGSRAGLQRPKRERVLQELFSGFTSHKLQKAISKYRLRTYSDKPTERIREMNGLRKPPSWSGTWGLIGRHAFTIPT